MITLPYRPRQAWLITFWVVFCAFAAGVMTLAARMLFDRNIAASALVATLVVVVAGAIRTDTMREVYALWNRVAGWLLHRLTQWTVSVTFYVIFVAVGRAGSRLLLDGRHSRLSLWVTRRENGSADPVVLRVSGSSGWLADYCLNAFRTGNAWACALLPFLALLALLHVPEEQAAPSGNIYTLY
jgi:hypothetical protein